MRVDTPKTDMNQSTHVEKQYASDSGLATRIAMHQKYSTNKQGFANWLAGQYQYAKGCKILELGCGNAAFWQSRLDTLPDGTLLVLSDFSAGMLEAARESIGDAPNVLMQKINIQDIPFVDESFDIAIANHMLHHVPDIPLAMAEVRRVLKPGGVFYCSANGKNGVSGWLHHTLKSFNPAIDKYGEGEPFSLQNGRDFLAPYFGTVALAQYGDSLEITQTQDLVDYIKSATTMMDIGEEQLEGLFDFLETIRVREGAIRIPKESGLFISTKKSLAP